MHACRHEESKLILPCCAEPLIGLCNGAISICIAIHKLCTVFASISCHALAQSQLQTYIVQYCLMKFLYERGVLGLVYQIDVFSRPIHPQSSVTTVVI